MSLLSRSIPNGIDFAYICVYTYLKRTKPLANILKAGLQNVIDLKFLRQGFNVKLRLSGISRVGYLELPNVSANIAVAILRVMAAHLRLKD
jgi:hypothetical protein